MILNIPETICKDEELHLLGLVSLILNKNESLVFFQTLRALESNKGKFCCKSSNIGKALGVHSLIKSNAYLSGVLGKLYKLNLITFRKKYFLTEDENGNQKSQLWFELKPAAMSISYVILNLKEIYSKKIRDEAIRKTESEERRIIMWEEERERLNQQQLSQLSNFSNFNNELGKIH